MEIRKIKHKYEQELKAKEEVQALVCRDYQERDQAWQLEKQVIHHFSKKCDFIRKEVLIRNTLRTKS